MTISMPYHKPIPMTKERVLDGLAGRKSYFESCLKSGEYVFLFSAGGCEITLAQERPWMPETIKVLRSEGGLEEKKEKLRLLGFPMVGKPTDMIISRFSASDQLEKRMKESHAEREKRKNEFHIDPPSEKTNDPFSDEEKEMILKMLRTPPEQR